MDNEKLMKDALRTIQKQSARIADLEKRLAASEEALTKARGGTPTVQDALAHAAANPQQGYANITAFLPALAEVGKARREQEAMPPAERIEKAETTLRKLRDRA